MSVLKIKDENGNWVCVPSIKGEKGDSGDAVPHAHRHATGGEDELTPADIGAANIVHLHSTKEIGAAPEGHSHTVEEIGASPEGHIHDERYYSKEETAALVKSGDVTWRCLADVSVADGTNGFCVSLESDLRNYSEAQVIIYPGDDFSGSCMAYIHAGDSSGGTYLGARNLYGGGRYTTIIISSIYEIVEGNYLFTINDSSQWTAGDSTAGTLITSDVESLFVYLKADSTFKGAGGRVVVIAR